MRMLAWMAVACAGIGCRTADTLGKAGAHAAVAGSEDPRARALALEAERRLTDPLAPGELEGDAARRAFEREGRAWARDHISDRVPGVLPGGQDPVAELGMPDRVGPASLTTDWRGARMVWQEGDVYGWHVVGQAGVATVDPDPYAEIHMTRRLPGRLRRWGPLHVAGSTRSSLPGEPLVLEDTGHEEDAPSVAVWITRDF